MKTTLAVLALLTLTQISSFRSFAQSNKPVLLEMFTNSHCGPCASAYGIINSQVKTSQYADDVVYIFYHVSTYTDDKLFQESRTESNPRASSYGVSSTPTVYIDGVRTGSSNWVSSIGARTQKSQSITFNRTVVATNSTLEIDISATSPSDLPNVKLLVAVVENVQYKGRNNVSQHQYVMRTMPTTIAGKDISLQANQANQSTYSVPLNSVWNKDSIGVVVFIQDATTREVYGSTIVRFDEISKVTSVENDKPSLPVTVLQKNSGATSFSFNSPISTKGSLQIYDVNGELVFSKDFSTAQDNTIIEWNNVNNTGNVVANGVYLYKIQIGSIISTGKFSL
ncbi:MAG: Omp28-related outer membrane protein [Candidatus Kapabacteria bacterium]|nr:Omp28-related outer membrane protein [Candidatus Kapabacteria bacterium]